MSDSQEISLSIEETNRLRLELGLKPLATNSDSAVVVVEKPATRNDARDSGKLEERLARSRQKRELVGGKTLTEDAQDRDDTHAWINASKKKEQELVEKRRRQQEEMDRELQESARQYTSADLKGIRVGHDLNELEGDDEHILVLKDASVLEDDVELISVQAAEKERTRKNLERKQQLKKPSAYQAYEDEMNKKGSLLAQYDEEEEQKTFTLPGNAIITKSKPVEPTVSKMDIDLDVQTNEIEDYSTKDEAAVSFKKPKKKKSSAIRKQLQEETEFKEAISLLNQAEKPAAAQQKSSLVSNYVDDEDLQAALAKTRKAVIRSQKSLKDIANEVESLENLSSRQSKPESGTIVLSDTSEFVQNLGVIITEQQKEVVPVEQPQETVADSVAEEKIHKMEEDVESGVHSEQEEKVHLIEEPILNAGVGSALSLLHQKGLLEKRSAEEIERDRLLLEKERWLMKRQKEQEALPQRRKKAKKEGERMDYSQMREIEEKFKDYKPTVNLEYVDDQGRQLTPKEAYKQLSYRFHGKGPGKAKTDKKLKKLAEEIKEQYK